MLLKNNAKEVLSANFDVSMIVITPLPWLHGALRWAPTGERVLADNTKLASVAELVPSAIHFGTTRAVLLAYHGR